MSNRGKVITKQFKCPAIYGRYPHPQSCEYYFECRFGWPTLWHCNRGYLYDKDREQCRDKRKVKCHIGHDRDHHKDKDDKDNKDKEIDVKEDMKYFKCPYMWGTFAHPYDCSKYYVCVYNYPKLFQCYKNFLFDTHYRKCLPSNRVKCGNRLDRDQLRTSRKPVTLPTTVGPVKTTIKDITEPPKKDSFYCPFPYGRYPDPSDCSRFYECRFSIPYLHKCPESTLYHERKEQCLNQKHVKCGNRPGGNDEDVIEEDDENLNFRCPYVWGTFAHPVDCSKYIICIYNIPSVFSCRKHELFDSRYRRCFSKEKVSCDGRLNPDDEYPFDKTTSPKPVKLTTTSVSTTRYTTTTPVPTTISTTTTSVPTTTPVSTTRYTTTTTVPTTRSTTTTPKPTTTTSTPMPTTTSTTTTTTTTPIPTTTTTTTTTTTRIPTTQTVPPTTSAPTTTNIRSTIFDLSTIFPVTKPNTPPPTDCDEDDLDCIIDGTGDVSGWFDCPKRFGHFPHGSSKQLFIHCDNWRPFVKKCADETEFSPVYLVCVWGNRKQSVA